MGEQKRNTKKIQKIEKTLPFEMMSFNIKFLELTITMKNRLFQ